MASNQIDGREIPNQKTKETHSSRRARCVGQEEPRAPGYYWQAVNQLSQSLSPRADISSAQRLDAAADPIGQLSLALSIEIERNRAR